MLIEVTQKHITEALRHGHRQTPVAYALRAALVSTYGERSWVLAVGTDDVTITKWGSNYGEDRHRVRLPHDARMFGTTFERGAEVSPFTFELDLSVLG